jgi:hypothetical protein
MLSAQELNKSPEAIGDTNTLRHFLQTGKFYGHGRSYWSATLNEKGLTDYYAWGMGVDMGYETPRLFKRFQLGAAGSFIFNLASSDLSRPDPTTGLPNRYEIGLFDIENPDKKRDLNRLDEFYVKAHLGKKSTLTAGRQIPQTPFINPQDGRMRPTLTEGAVLDFNEWQHLKLHAEYLWRISPRSTMRWFRIGESMGIYPVGVGADGKPSRYKGRMDSDYIAILGATYKKKQWEIQGWDTYVDNVLNTAFIKGEWKSVATGRSNWMAGMQLLKQNTVGNGGNSDALIAYAQPGSGAMVISGRIGRQSTRFEWYVNTTHITAKGRYLMPREWGKEPFYTFMPRERNDGFGNLTAATVNTRFKPEKRIGVELSGGYFYLPGIRNFALNKYGMPSYAQVNLGLNYQFDQYLKGLNAFLLVVRKDKIGETYENDRYVFNKVNMIHANLIFNYQF